MIINNKVNFRRILYYKFELFLLLLTIIGLILKFFYFYRLELDSDTAVEGLMTIEFWKYHNYFLSYFYVPSDDSYTFEVVIFHLLPQILSNFNPIMLNIVSFFIFLLIIIIFSHIIFSFTKSLLNTLFFSALLSNWYIVYGMIAFPHSSTILMIGLLLILCLFKPIKNWDIIFLVILAIATFSDSLILIWFIIPIIIVHFLKFLLRDQIVSFLKFDIVFKITLSSGIVMIFKKYYIEYYVNHTHIFHCIEWNCLSNTQIPILLNDLTSLFFYRLKEHQITFIDTLFIFFFIAYVILLINLKLKSIQKKYLIFFIFVGSMSITTSLFYITTAVPESYTARYIVFILIGLLSIFCMVDFNRSKYAKWLLLSIIIINLIYGVDLSFRINHSPNEEQYQLIDFLKKSNLTFGFGDYWDSNIITYLSHEDVIVRPIWIENGLVPRYWNSAKRWYENPPKQFFVIVRHTNEKALNYFYNNFLLPDPVRIFDYKNYKIFEYNMTNFDIRNRKFNTIKLFHSGGEKRYDPLIEGFSWYADKNIEGYIIYGPYISLPRGNYRVTYMIRSDSNVSANVSVAKLEIFDNRILKQIVIYDSNFPNTSIYQAFSLDFTSQNNKNLEFRIYKYSNVTLFIGNITLNELNNT